MTTAPRRPPIEPGRTFEIVDLHPLGCTCAECEAYFAAPPRFADAFDRVARDFLVGLAGAHGIVWLYDAATHGPGLFVMYGL